MHFALAVLVAIIGFGITTQTNALSGNGPPGIVQPDDVATGGGPSK